MSQTTDKTLTKSDFNYQKQYKALQREYYFKRAASNKKANELLTFINDTSQIIPIMRDNPMCLTSKTLLPASIFGHRTNHNYGTSKSDVMLLNEYISGSSHNVILEQHIFIEVCRSIGKSNKK